MDTNTIIYMNRAEEADRRAAQLAMQNEKLASELARVKASYADAMEKWSLDVQEFAPRAKKEDNRVDLEIELEHEEIYDLMLMAHKRDITLNQLIEESLNIAMQNFDESKITE